MPTQSICYLIPYSIRKWQSFLPANRRMRISINSDIRITKKEDFLREWDHLRSKFGTLPDPDLDLKAIDQNPGTEEKAIANITIEEYWKTVDEKDKIIIKMIEAGYTQKEIAAHLGMANNSGVSKRIAKLQKNFERKTGIKISEA